MCRPQKESLRMLMEQEERELRRVVKASSGRIDLVQRAKTLLSVASRRSSSQAAAMAGFKEGKSISHLVKRFNARGLAALLIADDRRRKPTYTSQDHARIVAQVQCSLDWEEDQRATWSLSSLGQVLSKTTMPRIANGTIRHVLHEHGYTYQWTQTWCHTRYVLRQHKSGTVTVYDEQTPEKRRLIELVCEQAKAVRIVQLNEDGAGPYQAISQPRASWEPESHLARLSHEYERGETAKLLTLFHPASGHLRAKGVVLATNVVLHPWLKDQLTEVLADIEKNYLPEELPPEAERPLCTQWKTWLWPHETEEGLPPLRILLVWDNVAGHLTPDLMKWLSHHRVMPPLHTTWWLVAKPRQSVQHIIVRRTLCGQHPKKAKASHRLVGANRSWLEQAAYTLRLEWQAQEASRASSSPSDGSFLVRHCQRV